jgi:TPR repeat protein
VEGNADAQYSLGVLHAKGEGVTQDYQEAIKLFRLSVEQGHAYPQSSFGWMYQNGQGVTQDYKEAVRWYRLAAEQERKPCLGGCITGDD